MDIGLDSVYLSGATCGILTSKYTMLEQFAMDDEKEARREAIKNLSVEEKREFKAIQKRIKEVAIENNMRNRVGCKRLAESIIEWERIMWCSRDNERRRIRRNRPLWKKILNID